jgi:hypothetical protein
MWNIVIDILAVIGGLTVVVAVVVGLFVLIFGNMREMP